MAAGVYQCVSPFNSIPNAGCICSVGNNEFNEGCTVSTNVQQKCPPQYNVFDNDLICKYQCPAESYQYFNYLTTNLDLLNQTTSGFNPSTQC